VSRQRLHQLGIAVAAVLFIAGAVIAVTQSGGEDGAGVEGGAKAAAVFTGVPQDGKVLGRASAPVILTEFADLQCPFCARFASGTLPGLVRRYVRTGRVRMELRVGRFLGPDSDLAARAAAAAALQDKLWQFAEVFYRNQGAENSGYVNEEFLRAVAEAVPGMDADRLIRDLGAPRVHREVAAVDARAQHLGVSGTPTFLLGRRSDAMRKLGLAAVEAASFTDSLDRLIGAER
jgi:protein-disulfide isomerase